MTDVFDVFARMDAAISEAADCADPAATLLALLAHAPRGTGFELVVHSGQL